MKISKRLLPLQRQVKPKALYEMDKKRSKEEIEDEIRLLKMAFELHTGLSIIKDEKEFEKHIDAILDRISELNKELKK